MRAEDYDTHGVWTRSLLIRRSIADGECVFFSTWCPAGTGIQKLVAIEGHRWAIEDSFEAAKNEFGLDHNETRSWHGWHRHVSMVLLAFAALAVTRHHANAARRANPGSRESRGLTLIRWSLQEIRRVAARLAQRRIRPALILAWSAWRRAHQAGAKRAHPECKAQLQW